MNFQNHLNKNYTNNSEIRKKNNSNQELLNKGYTIIRRNKETKKIEIIESWKTKEKIEKLKKKEFTNKLNNMINNWNNFRNDDIELRGDMSIYFNYKEELDKLIKEELEMEELFKESENIKLKDYDYSSDEESNKFLIY